MWVLENELKLHGENRRRDMKKTKSQAKENLEASHEQILERGQERFPLESYRQLLKNGATKVEALELLGYDPENPPKDVDELEDAT